MAMLAQLIPILGTLIGVLIGGGISLLTARYVSQNQRAIAAQNLAETRAIWAAERKIDKLNALYGAIEKLSDNAQEYRIRKAHETFNPEDIPKWVKPAYDARNDIENSISEAQNQAYLLDEEVIDTFEKTLKAWRDAFLQIESKDMLESLMTFESSLFSLKRDVADKVRNTFTKRLTGADLILRNA